MHISLINKIKETVCNPRKLVAYILYYMAPVFSDRTYLKLIFRVRMGQKLNLDNPKTYNQKLQWLKLYNRKPEYTRLVDKASFKDYISHTLGKEYIIPSIGVWDKFEDIDFQALPEQFVLKCTHDSGGLIVCRDKRALDISKARRKINKHLKRNYFYGGREWPYKNIKPRILVEQFMSTEKIDIDLDGMKSIDINNLQNKYGLLDYKFMCFDGEVKALFLDIGVVTGSEGHAHDYYRSVYDRNWEIMDLKETREHFPISINKPDFFDKMVEIAEKLSVGHPHIRVDLYYINEQIYVGELTFYHGSGLENFFIPNDWDYKFGEWIKLPMGTC